MIGFMFNMCFRGKPVNMENLMNPTGKDFEPEESAVLALIKERSKWLLPDIAWYNFVCANKKWFLSVQIGAHFKCVISDSEKKSQHTVIQKQSLRYENSKMDQDKCSSKVF